MKLQLPYKGGTQSIGSAPDRHSSTADYFTQVATYRKTTSARRARHVSIGSLHRLICTSLGAHGKELLSHVSLPHPLFDTTLESSFSEFATATTLNPCRGTRGSVTLIGRARKTHMSKRSPCAARTWSVLLAIISYVRFLTMSGISFAQHTHSCTLPAHPP